VGKRAVTPGEGGTVGLPEEDLPPAWLRDYRAIEADITKMEEFAAKLDAEVRENYGPHLPYVLDDMQARIPEAAPDFGELAAFLTTHDIAARDTTNLVHFYQNATGGFASAATEVSHKYREVDAFAAASLADVEAALDQTAAAKPQTPRV